MHWHLLKLNTPFGAEHVFHPHTRTKLNILNLSWESGVEKIGKDKMDRDTKIARKKKDIHNSLIHILRYFSHSGVGGKVKGGAIFKIIT